MPVDFSHTGTQMNVSIQGQLYRPLAYRPPDWIKWQLQNNPQNGTPEVYSLYGRTAAGLPRLMCWPTDNSTLVLNAYVRKAPELIDAPLQPHGTVTATAGLPNGTYSYKTTFVTASGESEGGDVSTNVVTGGLFQISVAQIRTWWGRTVTSRKLYRTVASGTQHKLVATISDNTTTTYIDNTQDASLGVDIPTWATAVTGTETFPDAFHESALYDGLVYLLASGQGDGRDVKFDAKWERSVARLWEETQQGQNEVHAFPAFPGFSSGHPVWGRWSPPR
jgi:hypothetical protein